MFNHLIVITAPKFFKMEASILNQLFEAGLTRLHLRKPGANKLAVRNLINEIDPYFRKCIIVHYHQDLVPEMELGGMHYSYHTVPNSGKSSDNYTFSYSLHDWDELQEVQEKMDYCFISPVSNSISKTEYLANEALQTVPAFARNVFALGGINEANCEGILDKGYCGVAVLGAIWEDENSALQRFKVLHEKLKNYGE